MMANAYRLLFVMQLANVAAEFSSDTGSIPQLFLLTRLTVHAGGFTLENPIVGLLEHHKGKDPRHSIVCVTTGTILFLCV